MFNAILEGKTRRISLCGSELTIPLIPDRNVILPVWLICSTTLYALSRSGDTQPQDR